jgi:hypothetical protein
MVRSGHLEDCCPSTAFARESDDRKRQVIDLLAALATGHMAALKVIHAQAYTQHNLNGNTLGLPTVRSDGAGDP